jgi:hypothetical protein
VTWPSVAAFTLCIAIPLLAAGQAAAAEIFLHRAAFWKRIAGKLMG